MREILFRGYRNFEGNALYPADKRWIYGYYVFRDGLHWIQDIDDMTMTYVVEEDSIGQLVGLHDKQGRPIYEGDRCGAKDGWTGIVEWTDSVNRIVGFWCHGSGLYSKNMTDLEVIGNIHENPELKKVQDGLDA